MSYQTQPYYFDYEDDEYIEITEAPLDDDIEIISVTPPNGSIIPSAANSDDGSVISISRTIFEGGRNTSLGPRVLNTFAALDRPSMVGLDGWFAQLDRESEGDLSESEIRARARQPLAPQQHEPPAPPETESSFTGSDTEAPEETQCVICSSGRAVDVQFRECSHAACTRCVKNIWWGRVVTDDHYPYWISCPWCRAEVKEVGMLLRQVEGLDGEVFVHEGVESVVYIWEKLVGWMTLRSKRIELRNRRLGRLG